MAPDVMSEVYRIQDDVMKQYLISIKYGSQTPIEVPEVTKKIPDAGGGKIELDDKAECTANGSGLVLAVVGKRARFNITTQTYKVKHLYVDISGPSGEHIRKKLVDPSSIKMKAGRQASKDDTVENSDLVNFDYQCVKTGSYQVNYVPRMVGIYDISISWGGEDIMNSPYTIRASLPKGVELPPPYKSTFSDTSAIPEETGGEGNESDAASHPGMLGNKGRRQSLVRQSHVTRRSDSAESTVPNSSNSSVDKTGGVDAGGGDASRTSPAPSMHRQASSMNPSMARGSSLLTRSSSVMYGAVDGPARSRPKRKVLRRIIKGAGGKEELIHYPQEQRQKPAGLKRGNSITTYEKPQSLAPVPSSPQLSPSRAVKSPATLKPAPVVTIKKPSNTPVAEKYGERMSKIILGRAMYEVSKRELLKKSTNSCSKSKPVNEAKQDMPKKPVQEKSSLQPQSNATSKISTPATPTPITKTLKEPVTKSGGKPLAELQQKTQEFSPQMSRESESPNSEREGPLGQEASEPTKGKHKPAKRASSNPLSKSTSMTNNPSTKTPLPFDNVTIGPVETKDRNGPDGQEKKDDEQESSVLRGYDNKKQTETKNSKSQLDSTIANNTKNKENIAPTTATTTEIKPSSQKTPLQQQNALKENQTPTPSSALLENSSTKVKTTKALVTMSSKINQSDTFKVKRLPANRPRAEKQTQCTAQGIKDETGWVSRRTVFQQKQKQKDKDNDSALGESRGSSMLVFNTDSRDVEVTPCWKSVEEKDISKSSKTLQNNADEKVDVIVENIPFRPRIPSDSAYIVRQRSRSMARQATFDSGFSDEQSHILGSQRSSRAVSRDHSNWQSRTPSASSTTSAVCFTPANEPRKSASPKTDSRKEHANADDDKLASPFVAAEPTQKKTPGNNIDTVIVPTNKSNSEKTTTSVPPTEMPLVDIAILPNVNLADLVVPQKSIVPPKQDSLTVGMVMINSTSPTPGNSPMPSSDQMFIPINSKSPSPTGAAGAAHSMYSSLDTSASGIAGMSARDIGEKLVSGDMSLDSLLQSLEHDPDYSTREFIRKFRPMIHDTMLDSVQEGIPDRDPATEDNMEGSHPGSVKSAGSTVQPVAEKCRASGVGLVQGLVNSKNNFQVGVEWLIIFHRFKISVTMVTDQPTLYVDSSIDYASDRY